MDHFFQDGQAGVTQFFDTMKTEDPRTYAQFALKMVPQEMKAEIDIGRKEVTINMLGIDRTKLPPAAGEAALIEQAVLIDPLTVVD